LDVMLLMLFLPMIALEARGVRIHDAGLAQIGAAVIVTGAQSVAGFPQLLVSDLSWQRLPKVGFRGAGVAARGTLIALPALLIFGSLLIAADDTFARVLRELVVFDIGETLAHLVMIAAIGAICAGFLRSLVFSGPLPHAERPDVLTLPAAETNFALGLVNLLFALFVGVQFRYFFGSAPDELAQYARRGFFELVWVVALVVPMLLLLEWLIDKEHGLKLFRILAAVQVALVFVIGASALHRMDLYRDAFGLTRLRFFTTAFMIWLGALLIWFVGTVLTGRRHRFAIGALATGMIVVVVLHAVNPDRIIVKTNVERARGGQRPFDASYAMRLSADAVPAILKNEDVVGPLVIRRFAHRRNYPMGWRTWNWSRAQARELVAPYKLRRYESKATPPIGRP
ncbi:MAG TPA: DUF4173 domain-containing protein, partial [Thermoanaerobaculia bacterium]|nr:DUF4173 domain-containing protein [Thermoanaerobaculia bacterium]